MTYEPIYTKKLREIGQEVVDFLSEKYEADRGLSKSQLNEIMLDLQDRATTAWEQCELIGMKDRDHPYYAGVFHGLTEAARLLTSYHLGIKL